MTDTPTTDNPDALPKPGVIDQAIDALDRRLVGRTDRARLRGAVDRADLPLTGRAGADAALKRIARMG